MAMTTDLITDKELAEYEGCPVKELLARMYEAERLLHLSEITRFHPQKEPAACPCELCTQTRMYFERVRQS